MAKPSIKCEMCGAHIEADTVKKLANDFRKHAKDAHDMHMSHEEALKKVAEAQELKGYIDGEF